MGDIADMMLDGTLCEGCGVYLDDDGADGYPRHCEDCQRQKNKNKSKNKDPKNNNKG